jgi:chromosome segregation ATPase
MLYLNEKLMRDMKSLDPEANFTGYSREYFRRKKVVSEEDEELLFTVEEICTAEENAQLARMELETEVDKYREILREREEKLKLKDAKIEEQRQRLQMCENENFLQAKNKTTFVQLEQYAGQLNQNLMASENQELKDQIRKLVELNNSLNLKLLDFEVDSIKLNNQLEEKSRSYEALSKDYQMTSQELAVLKFVENKRLAHETVRLEGDSSLLLIEISLMQERIQSFEQTFDTLNEYFVSLQGKKEIENDMARKVFELIDKKLYQHKVEFDKYVSRQNEEYRSAGALAREQMKSKVQQEKVGLIEFKLQALTSYNSILQNKTANLEKVLGDYLVKIKELEEEREKLEANSAIEKIKLYLENKKQHFDSVTSSLNQTLEGYEEMRRADLENAKACVDTFNNLKKDGDEQISALRSSFESRFEEIMNKTGDQFRALRAQTEETVRQKEEEIKSLTARLSNVEFEGKNDLITKLEILLEEHQKALDQITRLEEDKGVYEAGMEGNQWLHKQLEGDLQRKLGDQITGLKKEVDGLKNQLESATKERDRLASEVHNQKKREVVISMGLKEKVAGALVGLQEQEHPAEENVQLVDLINQVKCLPEGFYIGGKLN